MFIISTPGKAVERRHTCDFHKKNPGSKAPFSDCGVPCGCSVSWAYVEKPMNEWTDEEKRRMAGISDKQYIKRLESRIRVLEEK